MDHMSAHRLKLASPACAQSTGYRDSHRLRRQLELGSVTLDRNLKESATMMNSVNRQERIGIL